MNFDEIYQDYYNNKHSRWKNKKELIAQIDKNTVLINEIKEKFHAKICEKEKELRLLEM